MAKRDRVAVSEGDGAARIRLRVKPGGRFDRLVGPFDGALKLEVRAAPERGRANEAVLRLLADQLGVKRSEVELVTGFTGHDKAFAIAGVAAAEVVRRLEELGIAAELAGSRLASHDNPGADTS